MKQKILIGAIVDFMTFIPLIVVAMLYKKTATRLSKSKRMKTAFQKILTNDIFTNESKFVFSNRKLKNKFTFPWWFKTILYLISLIFMAISIFFTIIKGLFLKN